MFFIVDGQLRAQFSLASALGDANKRAWRIFDLVIAADNTVTINQLQFNGQPAPNGFSTDAQDAEVP